MCNPAALAVGSIVASAAGTGISVVGAKRQADAAQAQADYEAKINRNNARIAEQQAEDARERGVEAELDIRRQVDARVRETRANFASRGVTVDADSAGDFVSTVQELGEADAQTALYNAENEAFGFSTQAANFLNNANLADARGASAKRAGRLNMLASLTSGVGNTLSGASALGDFGGSSSVGGAGASTRAQAYNRGRWDALYRQAHGG